jgi:hypothetical protein
LDILHPGRKKIVVEDEEDFKKHGKLLSYSLPTVIVANKIIYRAWLFFPFLFLFCFLAFVQIYVLAQHKFWVSNKEKKIRHEISQIAFAIFYLTV